MDNKNKIKVLIICYVPELVASKEYKDPMTAISEKILSRFKASSQKNGRDIDVLDIIKCSDRTRTIKGLNGIADYLSKPNNKAIVYYYGHGDQVKDLNGDEDDGMDEKWVTQNILDDELSAIFSKIHDNSRLYLFSDSCSSGSMIDVKLNKRPWVTISSANDKQDAMATSEGGAFTIWGLLPGLESLNNPTPTELHNYIKKNLFFDTQTSTIGCGDKKILNEKIF